MFNERYVDLMKQYARQHMVSWSINLKANYFVKNLLWKANFIETLIIYIHVVRMLIFIFVNMVCKFGNFVTKEDFV